MLVFENHFYNIKTEEFINVICRLSKDISNNYIYELLSCEEIHIIFYSLDKSNINIHDCPCCLIYKIQKHNDKINIFIMFIATKYTFRSCGYASIFINEFMDFILDKYNYLSNINIILDSLEKSICFYENFGFKWIYTDEYNIQLNIETKNDNTEHFIMVYKLK